MLDNVHGSDGWHYLFILGGARPVIPPNLYTADMLIVMNIIAWGPQVILLLHYSVFSQSWLWSTYTVETF